MNRTLRTVIGIVAVVSISVMGLTSCVETDSDADWWGGPPSGWETFNDPRLGGCWILVQYNSDPVDQYVTDYMYFDGNGYGYYYYYDSGYMERERLRYWSQESYTGTSSYQINIQYEYSSPMTCNYWFTHGDNTLWMQMRTGGGRVQTYVYDRIDYIPW